MSIYNFSGVLGAAAGAPLAQTKGSETERASRDASAAERKTDAEAKAERSAGIGETSEDSATSDRDADGRKLWEAPVDGEPAEKQNKEAHRPSDPTGLSGHQLDLTG
ncbi:hypothetical protein Pla175_06980 [Pirellulimonas nuda]|uniref:Uncharacterized protein n=1 Tax=Pirellulimonas nuda TaxID=2528009 RepID=A0A518D7B9_9BACT|nr:hypothetical protein [Pirellulimonas nuda]QDU87339.1 hypothetical protein Pla175_06980 [Pirellulimonas nuda]